MTLEFMKLGKQCQIKSDYLFANLGMLWFGNCIRALETFGEAMSSKKFLSISAEDAAEQITDTVLNAGLGKAPFALVLGSGFSHGLVPTASELVEISLPLWMKSGRAENSFRDLKAEFPEGDAEIAKEFWENFCRNNRERDLVLPLSASTGLPESHSDAYRAAFDPRFKGK